MNQSRNAHKMNVSRNGHFHKDYCCVKGCGIPLDELQLRHLDLEEYPSLLHVVKECLFSREEELGLLVLNLEVDSNLHELAFQN